MRREEWGGAVKLSLDFAGRAQYVGSARKLIAELCEAELGSKTETSHWVMASQELLENLAKYAEPGQSFLDFELAERDGQPSARLRTRNQTSEERLRQATALLERVTTAEDPVRLYDELVAASGEGKGSRLGLIRLRAEAGLGIAYAVHGASLEIVVSGAVTAREGAARR
jgi:hypothetical protein